MTGTSSPIDMTRRLRAEREAAWQELEAMVERVERRGLKAMALDELRSMHRLYRMTLSSLALARTYALDLELMGYLNALAIRAFLLIYVPKQSLLQAIGHFFAYDLPHAVRANKVALLIAFLALAAGILFGWLAYAINPEFYYSLHPDDSRHPLAAEHQLAETLYTDAPFFSDLLTAFALFLFQNNVLVSLFAFALGFAFGVPTLLLLFYNGVPIGSMVALFWSRDLGPSFVAWLSVHGTTELLALLLAGAAGLTIARHMLFPEAGLSRLAALRIHGWQAATLMIGSMALLFVAAGFEGYLRQLIQEDRLRAEIGAGMALFWLVYFGLAGRGSLSERSPEP